MNRNDWLRVAAMSAAVTAGGCQAGAKATAPMTAFKSDTAKPQAVASGSAKPPSQSLAAPTTNSTKKTADNKPSAPKEHTAFYRVDARPAKMPRVLLSKADEAVCKMKVGEVMPDIALAKLGGNGKSKVADSFGKKATVVVFWKSDRRMTQQLLADLGPDVVEPFGKLGVAVVGIAEDESAKDAQAAVEKAGAAIPNLLDEGGKAFAQVGSEKLPRIYLLDPNGKILWFDIEYSLATRRGELHQALRAVLGEK